MVLPELDCPVPPLSELETPVLEDPPPDPPVDVPLPLWVVAEASVSPESADVVLVDPPSP